MLPGTQARPHVMQPWVGSVSSTAAHSRHMLVAAVCWCAAQSSSLLCMACFSMFLCMPCAHLIAYGLLFYAMVNGLCIHHCAWLVYVPWCIACACSILYGLCIHAGLQQTPQEIWEGLKSTLPALRGLLTSCSEVLTSGMLKLNNCLLGLGGAWLR